ncbi:Polar-differentiation response regulator DivK [subsurface metagenome]
MKKRILIVEDNPQNMSLMEMLLRAKGYILLKAIDGEEAMDMATTKRPDLILMDVQLPKMSGLEVTRRLRQLPAFNHIPIIAITAYAMKGDKEKFIGAGCDAYLPKPINTRELPRVISEMLFHQQKGNPSLNGDSTDEEDSCH